MSRAPAPWDAIRVINASGWCSGVKNLARTLLQWRNALTGEVWPSIRTIAKAMSTSESTTRAFIDKALKCGALVVIGKRSGGRRPTRYRLVLPESADPNPPDSGGFGNSGGPSNPGNPPDSAAQRTKGRCPTHRIPASNPPKSGAEPSRTNPDNHSQQPATDVIARLGIENLRDHPNATPDRLEWIAREAPGKSRPAGWAAKCIREGWDVPPLTEADQAEQRGRQRQAVLDKYDAMTESHQAAIMARVRVTYRNLDGHAPESPAVRGAIARVIEGQNRSESGAA